MLTIHPQLHYYYYTVVRLSVRVYKREVTGSEPTPAPTNLKSDTTSRGSLTRPATALEQNGDRQTYSLVAVRRRTIGTQDCPLVLHRNR